MVILVLHNIVVCKNSPHKLLVLQIIPYKMQIGTKSE
jgi:hypothetical protein